MADDRAIGEGSEFHAPLGLVGQKLAPQREGWRCYFALDEREHYAAAAVVV